MTKKNPELVELNRWWRGLSPSQKAMVHDTIVLVHLAEFLSDPARFVTYLRRYKGEET